MRYPTHPAARRRARVIAVTATQDLRLPLLAGFLLVSLACGLMSLIG